MKTHPLNAYLVHDIRRRARLLEQAEQVFPMLVNALSASDIDYSKLSLEQWKDLVLLARIAMRDKKGSASAARPALHSTI
ncbi:hypothetical protein [Lignipirellula cremea]|uniref:Uncharacterized protein n=1 Tax=Lignipirellula cremea TaxID=2528010 RepID=A0A518DMK2_9BACT|nr:hypothetical protein [Lignipirellula cremea]QDU93066.1 hypothetical protein Pla8534_08430 [Lignipirellula cremea]